MPISCKPLDDSNERAWDAFVASHPAGTFFHRAAWRHVIARAFGHRTHYTVAERDGAIVGVLPLAHVKSALFGSTLVSAPFCVYGGPLAVEAEAEAALAAHAVTLQRRTGAGAVEFRFLRPTDGAAWADEAEWPSRTGFYVTFRKPIAPDAEANMKRSRASSAP